MGQIIKNKIISDFEQIQKDLPLIIEKWGVLKTKLADLLDIQTRTFNNRMKNCRFTVEEMKIIAKFINRE